MKNPRRLQGIELLEGRAMLAASVVLNDSAEPPPVPNQAEAFVVGSLPRLTTDSVRHYTENSRPVSIAPRAALSLPKSVHAANGRLTVKVSANRDAHDRLAVKESGRALSAEQGILRRANRVVGRIQRGNGGTYAVQFNSQATSADVERVLRGITFRTLGDDPSPLPRTVAFQFTDRAGHSSNQATTRVLVKPINDSPRIAIQGGQTFQPGRGPSLLAPYATIVDPDTSDFQGGELVVDIALGSQSGDRLLVRSEGTSAGQIKAANGKLYFEGREFGIYYGGNEDISLVARFKARATPAAVQELLRSITFVPGTAPLNYTQRSVTFEINDQFRVESHTYKEVDGQALTLGVVKPVAWKPSDRRPAIVFVAGTWTVQGKDWWNERMTYLASRGIVCIRATYRLISQDTKEAPDAPSRDIKSAMRWVRSHASELGIDPKRIGVMGSSAGGHLAAVAGMINGLNDRHDKLSVSAKANALILFNAIIDTGPSGWSYSRTRNRYREFSPLENVSRDDPPTFAAYGGEDPVVRRSTVLKFQAALSAAGIKNDVRLWAGQVHGFTNVFRNHGQYFYETLVAVDRFLASLGWTHGPPTLARPAALSLATIGQLPWHAGLKHVVILPPSAPPPPPTANDAFFLALATVDDFNPQRTRPRATAWHR